VERGPSSCVWSLLAVLSASTSLGADLPPFEGRTGASVTTKYAVLNAIATPLRASLGCSVVAHVQTRELHSDERIPPSIALPRATGRVTWERWTVTACGKQKAFVVAYWSDLKGGMDYRVAEDGH